jgi:hypothetical protein
VLISVILIYNLIIYNKLTNKNKHNKVKDISYIILKPIIVSALLLIEQKNTVFNNM